LPAKDVYHDLVKRALIKDNWTILKENFKIPFGTKKIYVDLTAEKILLVEKDKQKIAVEIKSFLGKSAVNELHKAIGQYQTYFSVIKRELPEFILYLAIPASIFIDIFQDRLGLAILEDFPINLLVFDVEEIEEIKWQPEVKL